jgi:hypothetical protein
LVFIPEVIFALFAALREERKTGCLSGKGMNESFKYEEENIIKDKGAVAQIMIVIRGPHY